VKSTTLGTRDAEVITTPYTWGGTLAGLMIAGNKPVFADIDADTLTLDPEAVVQRITRKTRAILTVDIYGYPSNGPALREIADKHGLVLIQDCAQSFGAYLDEHHTGWWADAAVFSFSWGKALFAGEGGMIVTRHKELFERLVWETQHPHRQLRDVPHLPKNEFGLNLRVNPLAAVWAETAFTQALATIEQRRKRCWEILTLLHRRVMSKTKILDNGRVKPSFHVLTFGPACDLERLELFLVRENPAYEIGCAPITRPLYESEAFGNLFGKRRRMRIERCAVAEEQCARRLRLLKTKNGRRDG
jgi:dTDP-4-amino-4,6-dideoxygalactose transaminase